jgi:hypothetical protein
MNYKSNTQPGGYDAELEQWLAGESSLLGERSAFDGLIASIERGTGGCKGTKGVGSTRHEPFENWPNWPAVIGAVDRSTACRHAFFALTTHERWLLCARYLPNKSKLPPGLIGALGDLSAVSVVLAEMLGIAPRLWSDAGHDARKAKLGRWENIAAIALEEAHRAWKTARARVASEVDKSEEATG